MYMCGVSKEHFTFKEFKSDFDPRRSPIHYVPTMRVDRRADDLGPLWSMLDRVISRRKERKGIIHTISYARQLEIKERSRYWEKMIINPQGSPATDTVEDFKFSNAGTVLVSPSVGEGYDFPDDDCRWQFVCKIPFEPPSKIVKAREHADPEYRAYQALQSLVQAFGRGMRNEKDWCEGFICDSHMDWFWPRFRHLAPQSFHSVLTRSDALPPPLNPEKL
jgi:Rad3-related DNA helicase